MAKAFQKVPSAVTAWAVPGVRNCQLAVGVNTWIEALGLSNYFLFVLLQSFKGF